MTTQQIDAQKYAAGLELNLAAVIQRAEAAERRWQTHNPDCCTPKLG